MVLIKLLIIVDSCSQGRTGSIIQAESETFYARSKINNEQKKFQKSININVIKVNV